MSSKWYLTHAIIIWAVTILIAWYGISEGNMGDPRLRDNCVGESIRNAEEWIKVEGRPARIVIFEVNPGYDHAQAVGQEPNGSWTYLTRHKADGILRRWQRHFELPIKRWIDVDTFVKEQEMIE